MERREATGVARDDKIAARLDAGSRLERQLQPLAERPATEVRRRRPGVVQLHPLQVLPVAGRMVKHLVDDHRRRGRRRGQPTDEGNHRCDPTRAPEENGSHARIRAKPPRDPHTMTCACRACYGNVSGRCPGRAPHAPGNPRLQARDGFFRVAGLEFNDGTMGRERARGRPPDAPWALAGCLPCVARHGLPLMERRPTTRVATARGCSPMGARHRASASARTRAGHAPPAPHGSRAGGRDPPPVP